MTDLRKLDCDIHERVFGVEGPCAGQLYGAGRGAPLGKSGTACTVCTLHWYTGDKSEAEEEAIFARHTVPAYSSQPSMAAKVVDALRQQGFTAHMTAEPQGIGMARCTFTRPAPSRKWTTQRGGAAHPRLETAICLAAIEALAARPAAYTLSAAAPERARPKEEWVEEEGEVLWWVFPVQEAPYVGSPLDEDWPGYHTHWTPLPPPPEAPEAHEPVPGSS